MASSGQTWRRRGLAAAVASVTLSTWAGAEQPRQNRDVLEFEPARPVRMVIAANQVAQEGAGEANAATQTVYVPDSSRAVERLRLAERLEGQREWAKAAEVYQEVVEQLGDRVLPAEGEAGSGAGTGTGSDQGRFVTVTRRVEARLGAWPAEGLRAYQARYEVTARDLLRDAMADNSSEAGLAAVLNRYFVTSAGLEAGVRLADLRLENGEAGSAQALLRRLLERHPGLKESGNGAFSRAAVLARAALAAALAGDATSAEAARQELTEKHPGARGAFGGREDVALAEAVKELPAARGVAMGAAMGVGGTDWVMPGGDATRARVSRSEARATASVGAIELPEARGSRQRGGLSTAVIQQQMRDTEERERMSGAGAVVMPSVVRSGGGGGELFFQDGFRVWGVSLESGMPLAGWAATYPASAAAGGRAGVFTLQRPQAPAKNHQYSVTVAGDSVLAVMGYVDVRAAALANQEVFASHTRLVRLERASGRVIWEAAPRDLTGEQAGLSGLELSGSPVVIGDAVYVSARGSKGNQFDDAYVLAFELATGRLRWSCYLASAASPVPAWMDSAGTTGTVVHLAAAGGTLYAQTNLGALAAVDAATGRPEWISLYRRDTPEAGAGMNPMVIRRVQMSQSTRPWAFNAPMVVDVAATEGMPSRLVFSLPTDGRDLVVMDAADGREIRRVPRAAYDNADTLVYADAERVVLSSEKEMWCLDWRKSSGKPTLKPGEEGPVLWKATFGGSTLRGRPFVAGGSVVVPTAAKLYWVDLKGGKTVLTVPGVGATWKGIEGQGNVVAAGDHLVIATPVRVEIRTDLAVAEAKYRREVEAAPRDPMPRLTWAEVSFNAGREGAAFDLLDEAAGLIDQGGAERARAQLYSTAMAFAEVLSRRAGDGPAALGERAQATRAAALRLYDRAATAAGSPQQQVEWRRRKATALSAAGDLAGAVALWQQVLEDDGWREAIVADATPAGAGPAGQLAEREIAEAVKRSPQVYAPYEARAAEAASAGSASPGALVRVAARFPNSTSAAPALLTAATRLEAAGDRRGAARVLRDLYFRYPAFDRRAEVLEAMARVYLATPGQQATALARLATAARAYPDRKLGGTLAFSDGTALQATTFAEAAELLRARGATTSEAALPDVALPDRAAAEAYRQANGRRIAPVEEMKAQRIQGVVQALEPLAGAGRRDRVVVKLTTGEIAAVAPGGRVEWTARGPGVQPRGCAWSGETLVAWDDTTVVGIDGLSQGKSAWRLSLSSLPAAETLVGAGAMPGVDGDAAGGDAGEDEQQNVMVGGQARVLVRGNQRIVVRGGNLIRVLPGNFNRGGAARVVGEQVAQMAVRGDRLLVATTAGRVMCVSTADGRVLWQVRPLVGAAEQLLSSEEFVVVRSTEDNAGGVVVALNADTGAPVWRRNSRGAGPASDAPPQNMALAPDGTLLITLPDRIVGKDLFEPGPAPTFETTPDGSRPFELVRGPEQLLVWEGMLLAVTDGGQFVRAYNLAAQCKPVRFAGAQADALLATLSRGRAFQPANQLNVNIAGEAPGVSMRLSGKYLYVTSPRAVVSYDLTRGESDWNQVIEDVPGRSGGTYLDVQLARGFVLAITTPRTQAGGNAPAGGNPPAGGNAAAGRVTPEARVQVLSTAQVAAGDAKNAVARQSGMFLHEFVLTDLPADLRQLSVQPVEGGIFYLAAAGELRFLRGTGGK